MGNLIGKRITLEKLSQELKETNDENKIKEKLNKLSLKELALLCKDKCENLDNDDKIKGMLIDAILKIIRSGESMPSKSAAPNTSISLTPVPENQPGPLAPPEPLAPPTPLGPPEPLGPPKVPGGKKHKQTKKLLIKGGKKEGKGSKKLNK